RVDLRFLSDAEISIVSARSGACDCGSTDEGCGRSGAVNCGLRRLAFDYTGRDKAQAPQQQGACVLHALLPLLRDGTADVKFFRDLGDRKRHQSLAWKYRPPEPR